MKNIKKFVKRKGHHIAAVLVVVLILVTAGVCVSIPVIKVTNKRKASKDVLVSNTIQVADSTYGIPGNSADADNSYVELADGDPQSDNMSQELSENGIELNFLMIIWHIPMALMYPNGRERLTGIKSQKAELITR